MSKIAVIFDTNACHSERTEQTFFGKRKIMREIAARATVFIPRVVIDELLQQNKEGTFANITSLKGNTLLATLGFDFAALDNLDSQNHAMALYQQEDIPHQVIDIVDTTDAYRKMRSWCIAGSAPFNSRNEDGKNNSDKGIKDALIACTVDELAAAGQYDAYYLACHDGRLREYYKNNPQVVCLSPDAILKELQRTVFDEYTLDVVQQELELSNASFKDSWQNINSDYVGHIDSESGTTLVILDATSKELIRSLEPSSLTGPEALASCSSYDAAHTTIAEMADFVEFYSLKQLADIKVALLSNDQIYGIGTDEDIKAFASRIFTYFYEQLDSNEKEKFNVYYELREIN